MRNASWIIVLSLTSVQAFAEERTIEPGLYEVVTKAGAGGATTARVCLTADNIASGLQPSDPGKGCKKIRSVVADGKLDFATTCPDMTMTMTGSYTSTSYVVDGKLEMKGDDGPTTIDTHITAKRISTSCNAD
ncbi:MAG: DUF3617 family protein [Burkholderiaceae bacterium]